MAPSVIVFADNIVGSRCIRWLISHFLDDISLVVSTSENDIYNFALSNDIPAYVYTSEPDLISYISSCGYSFDLGLLLWWPNIIHEPVISLPRRGFVNTHPSFLPYNRGKHPNFWSLVTNTPAGVTLHQVDQGIDSGRILAQKIIPTSWVDDGETLYQKSLIAMFDLFVEFYPILRTEVFDSYIQPQGVGSYHKDCFQK